MRIYAVREKPPYVFAPRLEPFFAMSAFNRWLRPSGFLLSRRHRLFSQTLSLGRLGVETFDQPVEIRLNRSDINRYGDNDGVVHLNVGGTKFVTLRSTLAQSSVLHETLMRAADNRELALDGVVFVDRDPKHFNIILSHLRNAAEGREPFTHSKVRACLLGAAVQLPTDKQILRDLYTEAAHYDLSDLCDQVVCKVTWYSLVNISSSGKNPFDAACRSLTVIRATLMGLVGAGATIMAVGHQLQEAKDPWEMLQTVKSIVA